MGRGSALGGFCERPEIELGGTWNFQGSHTQPHPRRRNLRLRGAEELASVAGCRSGWDDSAASPPPGPLPSSARHGLVPPLASPGQRGLFRGRDAHHFSRQHTPSMGLTGLTGRVTLSTRPLSSPGFSVPMARGAGLPGLWVQPPGPRGPAAERRPAEGSSSAAASLGGGGVSQVHRPHRCQSDRPHNTDLGPRLGQRSRGVYLRPSRASGSRLATPALC